MTRWTKCEDYTVPSNNSYPVVVSYISPDGTHKLTLSRYSREWVLTPAEDDWRDISARRATFGWSPRAPEAKANDQIRRWYAEDSQGVQEPRPAVASEPEPESTPVAPEPASEPTEPQVGGLVTRRGDATIYDCSTLDKPILDLLFGGDEPTEPQVGGPVIGGSADAEVGGPVIGGSADAEVGGPVIGGCADDEVAVYNAAIHYLMLARSLVHTDLVESLEQVIDELDRRRQARARAAEIEAKIAALRAELADLQGAA